MDANADPVSRPLWSSNFDHLSFYLQLIIVIILFIWCVIFLFRGWKRQNYTASTATRSQVDPGTVMDGYLRRKGTNTSDFTLSQMMTSMGMMEICGTGFSAGNPLWLGLGFLLFLLSTHFIQHHLFGNPKEQDQDWDAIQEELKMTPEEEEYFRLHPDGTL